MEKVQYIMYVFVRIRTHVVNGSSHVIAHKYKQSTLTTCCPSRCLFAIITHQSIWTDDELESGCFAFMMATNQNGNFIGEQASRDLKFCPLSAVAKFPYIFMKGADSENVSKAYFAEGKFQARGWTL